MDLLRIVKIYDVFENTINTMKQIKTKEKSPKKRQKKSKKQQQQKKKQMKIMLLFYFEIKGAQIFSFNHSGNGFSFITTIIPFLMRFKENNSIFIFTLLFMHSEIFYNL